MTASVLEPRPFRTACALRHFLVALSSFSRGCESLTRGRSTRCPLLAECGYRSRESREGGNEYGTGRDRIWFSQYPSNNDQRGFSPLPR